MKKKETYEGGEYNEQGCYSTPTRWRKRMAKKLIKILLLAIKKFEEMEQKEKLEVEKQYK